MTEQKNILAVLILILSGFATTAQNVQIEVDATRTIGKLEPVWSSQIVHPTEFLLTEWGENFIRLFKETGASRDYVRIYNQPEEAIRVSSDGKISYDWSRFDKMAELILQGGSKLKVVFFGMPYELASHPEVEKRRPYGAKVCISPPKDYKQWEELCSDFTRHAIKKYGINEVKQWTFRCWNEPDLSGFWMNADLEEYLKLYDHFAKAVKAVHPEIIIGGPALSSTGTYKKPENLIFFLDHITKGKNYATGETGSPIDYLGIHTYGGSAAGGGPGYDFPAYEYMMKLQMLYVDIRDKYQSLKNIPIHVEEWGITSGGTTGVESKATADVRNSEYGAAFLATMAANHFQMKHKNDPNIESYTFCSSGYEKIPAHDFMGYRTLDTKNGFHKPILNAYKLLDRLASEVVPVEISSSHNNVTACAGRDPKRITIVVVNYQFDKIYSEGESYPVTLDIKTGWKPGSNVSMKHWRIDKNHSNAYTVFKELGSPELPNPFEIDAIKDKMGLELLEPEKQSTAAEMARIEFELSCNGVSLIEITRK